MITKLPKWILWGGAVLAFSAGCVNTAALMGFTNLSVSHVTGNVSLFAAAIAYLDVRSILYVGALLLSFLAGAILSGYVIGQTSLKLGRRYGSALYIEAALLMASYWLYQQHDCVVLLTYRRHLLDAHDVPNATARYCFHADKIMQPHPKRFAAVAKSSVAVQHYFSWAKHISVFSVNQTLMGLSLFVFDLVAF